MIYKHKESKLKRINLHRVLLTVLFCISFIGLCTGCLFALKNADNFDFVKQITITEKYIQKVNTGIFEPYSRILIRDVIICCSVLFLKYSGLQKSIVICIPFIMSVQNGAVYTVLLSAENISVFHLLFNYVFKDTAVLLIITLYVYTIIKQIINNKNNIKKDIYLLIFYIAAIILIYIIYFIVKYFIYSGV